MVSFHRRQWQFTTQIPKDLLLRGMVRTSAWHDIAQTNVELRPITLTRAAAIRWTRGIYVSGQRTTASHGDLSGGILLPSSFWRRPKTEIRLRADGWILEMVFVSDTGLTGPGTYSARTRGPGETSFSSPLLPKTIARPICGRMVQAWIRQQHGNRLSVRARPWFKMRHRPTVWGTPIGDRPFGMM